jgi:hypothetical protein
MNIPATAGTWRCDIPPPPYGRSRHWLPFYSPDTACHAAAGRHRRLEGSCLPQKPDSVAARVTSKTTESIGNGITLVVLVFVIALGLVTTSRLKARMQQQADWIMICGWRHRIESVAMIMVQVRNSGPQRLDVIEAFEGKRRGS